MTREEINALDMDSLEKRAGEIAEETREANAETLETLTAELDAIEERKAAIMAEAVEKRAQAAAVINGAGEVIEEKEENKEERKMADIEIRATKEYLDAWVENMKGRATQEQRALLTQNVPQNGTIAIPTYVEGRINTAWERNEIMRRVRRTYFPGNLKVGYEASSEEAIPHGEGGAAITEEELVVKFVELIPQTLKKMVRYSTEVLDMKGEAFVDYIVDEVEYQIVKTAASFMIEKGSTVTDPSDPLVKNYTTSTSTLTTADIINAEGLLFGDANPVLITTRSTAAQLKAAAIAGHYGYDPFDGLEVIYVESADLARGVAAIVADLSAWQMNFPDGDQVKFVFDEYTEAAADIVRVIGRLYMAVAVVAPGKTVAIKLGA